MNPVEAALRRAARDLDALGVPWALVGGFAVSARAEPRFTRDVDIAVAVADDDAAESVVRALLAADYGLTASVEHDVTGRLATIRLASPVARAVEIVVDLLFASSGIENEIAEAAEPVEIVAGLTLPVARTGHLIALKVLARDDIERPQDAADLVALTSVATAEDMSLAAEALRIIADRGYGRDRDLLGALRALDA